MFSAAITITAIFVVDNKHFLQICGANVAVRSRQLHSFKIALTHYSSTALANVFS